MFLHWSKKIIWKIIGILAILYGVVAFLTPFTPGSWLVFVGLFIIFGRGRTEGWVQKLLGEQRFQKLKNSKFFEESLNTMSSIFIKPSATIFLRLALFFIGAVVLALCIFALPEIWRGGSLEFPEASNAVFLIVSGLYATTAPFFIALWQALKLLRYVDQNKTFSEASVRALRNIKYCATAIAILYVGGIPLLFPIADADDAPGLVAIGAIIACAPIVVAVFTGLLEKLVQSVVGEEE